MVRAARAGTAARGRRARPLCSHGAAAAAARRGSARAAARSMMAILMCQPEYFGIEYEINPWMHVSVKVDHALAETQWTALYATYQRLGVTIELAEPHAGLPDMVFTANAAVIWNGAAVLSNFRYAQRQGEQEHWREVLENRGLAVQSLPGELVFE